MLILLQQLTQDIRFGFRTFVRTPGFTTLAVLSLALGIMATTAMYSVIHAVVLDPFPYKDVDALMSVRVWNPEQEGFRTNYSTDEFLEIAERNTIFDGTIASTISDVLWTDDGDPQRLRGNYGTANTFHGHGRSGAAWTSLRARRWTSGRGAGGRTRLPILAAAVRRRPERRRTSAPPERHGADCRRGDAEAVHVARGGRLPARHLRARTRGRGHQERAPARTAEAGRDRGASRGRPQTDHRGPRAEGALAVPEGVAGRAALVQGDVSEQHPRGPVGALWRGRLAAVDRVRECVEPAAVESRGPAAGDGRARRARRQPLASRAAAADRERAPGDGGRRGRHGARVRCAARDPDARATEYDSRRVRGRRQRAGAALRARGLGGDERDLRAGAGHPYLHARSDQSAAQQRSQRHRRDGADAPAEGPRGRGGGAVDHADGRRQPDDQDGARGRSGGTRFSTGPRVDVAGAAARAQVSGSGSSRAVLRRAAPEHRARPGRHGGRSQHVGAPVWRRWMDGRSAGVDGAGSTGRHPPGQRGLYQGAGDRTPEGARIHHD